MEVFGICHFLGQHFGNLDKNGRYSQSYFINFGIRYISHLTVTVKYNF